jgi:hypothetical protein
MNKSFLIGSILSIIFAFICYFATENIFVSVAVFGLTLLFFGLIIQRRFNKYFKMIKRFHNCYYFINNFIVSLSVKESISGAFLSASESLGQDFKEEQEGIQDLTENEKILYLKRFFPFHLYSLFTDIIVLWCEQGGDILAMSNYLCNECRETEEYIIFCQSENRKIVVEFSLLWAFSLLILSILRLVLADFYHSITQQAFYPYAVLGIFIILLLSVELLTKRMTKIDIRGWNYGEK